MNLFSLQQGVCGHSRRTGINIHNLSFDIGNPISYLRNVVLFYQGLSVDSIGIFDRPFVYRRDCVFWKKEAVLLKCSSSWGIGHMEEHKEHTKAQI